MFESANAQQFEGLLYCLSKFTMVIFTFLDIRDTVGDRSNREDFEQFVARKHYITKQDVTNTRRRVHDRTIIKHLFPQSSKWFVVVTHHS